MQLMSLSRQEHLNDLAEDFEAQHTHNRRRRKKEPLVTALSIYLYSCECTKSQGLALGTTNFCQQLLQTVITRHKVDSDQSTGVIGTGTAGHNFRLM
jgi:hypothetical protein